jgi:hypothetical protein
MKKEKGIKKETTVANHSAAEKLKQVQAEILAEEQARINKVSKEISDILRENGCALNAIMILGAGHYPKVEYTITIAK